MRYLLIALMMSFSMTLMAAGHQDPTALPKKLIKEHNLKIERHHHHHHEKTKTPAAPTTPAT